MSDPDTNVIIDTRAAYRRAAVSLYTTSRPVVAAMLAGAVACGAVAALAALNPTHAVYEALLLILFGGEGLLFLIFTYGATAVPYQNPPATVQQLAAKSDGPVNIAHAMQFRTVLFVQAQHPGAYEDISSCISRLMQFEDVQGVFRRLMVDPQAVHRAIEEHVLPSYSWAHLVRGTIAHAQQRGRQYISVLDIAAAVLLHSHMHLFWQTQKLRQQDVAFVLWWQWLEGSVARAQRKIWEKDRLLAFSGIGLSWASGYTPFIDRFSRIPRGNVWDISYGHTSQVTQVITTLARSDQSNVLLVGDPGVGRLGVVRELDRRIRQHTAHPELNGKRMLYINIGELASVGTSDAGQVSLISRALDEMERAGNIIAVIDGIGSVLGAQGESRVNIADVLTPFFASHNVRTVIIMSTDEYHVRIRTQQDELQRLFEVVRVPELTEAQTLELIAITMREWEAETHVYIPYPVIKHTIDTMSSLLPYIPFPEKAFDVLSEAIVGAQTNNKTQLVQSDVDDLIARKIGVHVGAIEQNEQAHLLRLEEIIHERVVNQNAGVAAVARAMIRARAGIRRSKKPIGSFLFLGPTGVGKTETAKALAEAYFGSDTYVRRLDMNQYTGPDGVAQLIGDTRHPTGTLTSLIADNPFCVLLLDEFEKANPVVQQLFMPVLDEGYITDARGKRYSFAHTIIIVTSNAGAEFIRTSVGEDGTVPEGFDETLREHVLSQGVFRPEILNRFSGVVTFVPLTRQHVEKIARNMMKRLNGQLDMTHGVTVDISPELIAYLVQRGYDPEFGARPMARAIQDTVEYAAARRVVEGTARPGDTLVFTAKDLEAVK